MDNSIVVHTKLSELFNRYKKAENDPLLKKQLAIEFETLLHAENDFFISDSSYHDKLADLLNDCINSPNDMSDIIDVLLATDLPLKNDHVNLIDSAAVMGKVDIYQKIEAKILAHPEKDPELYESVKSGKNFEKYLKNAIQLKKVNFIKMLLNKKTDFNYLNEEGKTIKDLIDDNQSVDDIVQALLDKKILDPISLYKEKLSKNIITPELFKLILSKATYTFEIAYSTIEALNSSDYSNEYKKNIFHSAAPLFSNMSVDHPLYPDYLCYVINNFEKHHDDIKAHLQNKFDIKTIVINEDLLNNIKLNELLTNPEAPEIFGQRLFDDFKFMLTNSLIEGLKNRHSPINQSQLEAISPQLYENYLNKIHQMIFIQQSKETKKETHQEPLKEGKVIYNNNQYLASKPEGQRFVEGNALYLDGKNNTPIGYNIHLPTGKVEGVMVEMYGGNSKGQAEEKGYRPGQLTQKNEYLLNRGIAVVTLNLPDFLKLEVTQGQMPEPLYLEIQQCIKKFYDTLKHNPEALHDELKTLDMANLKMYLIGASFGGGMAVRHAELFNTPNSFDGYISHDGAISTEMLFNSDLAIVDRQQFNEHLNTAREAEIKKINKPILLMQNRDDNNVNIKVTTDFYNKMVTSGKTDLARLFVTDVGKAAPSDPSDIHNKGHLEPTNKNDFIVYCETILNFIKKGPSALPEHTEFEGYRQDELANKFYKSGTLEQKFVAESVEIFEKRLSEVEALTPTMVHDADIRHQIESEWEEKYKPLYLTIYQASFLSNKRIFLQKEIVRLKQNNLLTDEVIINTLQYQSDAFLEFFNAKLAPEVKPYKVFAHPDIIKKFREMLDQLSRQRNPGLANYFLASLYKANPSLLEPLYPTFDSNPSLKIDHNNAKEKLINTLARGKKLLFSAYEAQSKLEHKNNVPAGPENTSDALLKSKVKKDFKL